MKLSVIVPVYNMASQNKLSYCMDSLVRQTHKDLEILAVDDCSTDESYAILKEYERRFPGRVRAFQSEVNHHQGGAKNIGLSHADGDWIGFIDADDWVVPDFYERLLRKALETGADCVGTDYSLVYSHTMTPGTVVHNNKLSQTGVLDEPKYRSLMLDFGSLCVKIYRREIILDFPSRFPEDIFYEDNALAKTWISRIKHFEYIPEPLYFYYQHAASTVHTVTKKRLQDRMESAGIMLSEAKRYGYYERFKPEIEYSFTVLFYQNTLFSAMRAMREKGRYNFVTSLSRQMRETFPEFMKNPYYTERTSPEEKKYMAMQQKSPLRFYLQYLALWKYRDLKNILVYKRNAGRQDEDRH